jgi:hypothetical protein
MADVVFKPLLQRLAAFAWIEKRAALADFAQGDNADENIFLSCGFQPTDNAGFRPGFSQFRGYVGVEDKSAHNSRASAGGVTAKIDI